MLNMVNKPIITAQSFYFSKSCKETLLKPTDNIIMKMIIKK